MPTPPENPPAKRGLKLPKFMTSRHVWLSSGKEYNALPSAIRGAIERQQDDSERLIGWIQFAILSAFAVLYIAAPKTIPTGAAFEPVPVFLGAYCAFTCLRLWVAYKTSLPSWFLVVSILVDMALLFGLIWSFHLQYAQPPSFYLKAPTLLYIFIFIAMRGLRFEPGYVLLSGIVGAAGWLALVAFAIAGESGAAAVTRDYVDYLTSSRVLLGGEVDKIISILVVTIVLTLAIARARRLLIQSIVESSAAASLSHYVPKEIAERIAASDGPLQPDTREATILFADLVSFTSMSERLSPNALITTLNEYLAVISEPIVRNHGEFCYFQGDAILASFNLPSSNLDHASSAVAAAIDIQRLLKNHTFSSGETLQARIGINTGAIVGGTIGTPDGMKSYTVYGDDVNIAARLEQLNKTYQSAILVSERTMELSDQQRFAFAPKGSEVLRGRQTSINIFTPSLLPSETENGD